MAEHRVRAFWHPSGPRCPAQGTHTWVLCSCGWQETAECADEVSTVIHRHNRLAIWYDHRGVPVAGFR